MPESVLAVKNVQVVITDTLSGPLLSVLNQWAADRAAEGWTRLTDIVTTVNSTALGTLALVDAANPDAVFLIGLVPGIQVGPFSPDGHASRLLLSDQAYGSPGAAANLNGWNWQTDHFANTTLPSPMTRMVGRIMLDNITDISNPIAEYINYFNRLHAFHTGAKVYEKRAWITDHFSTTAGVTEIGNIVQFGPNSTGDTRGATAWIGAGNITRNDFIDWDPGDGGGGHYYEELDGHSWTYVHHESGGYGPGVFADGYPYSGGGNFYIGNTAAALAIQRSVSSPLQRPNAAYWTHFGSYSMEWGSINSYLMTLGIISIGAFNVTDGTFGYLPRMDLGTLATKSFPAMAKDTINASFSLAMAYIGDPTVPVITFGTATPINQFPVGVGIAANENVPAGTLAGAAGSRALFGVGIPSAETHASPLLSLPAVGGGQQLIGFPSFSNEVMRPGTLTGGVNNRVQIPYPVGLLVDDAGAVLSAPVITVAAVFDVSGATITGGIAAVTVNGSGTAIPISVTYDAEVHGEGWIMLGVTQSGHTITGVNASIPVFAARDSSRLGSMYGLMLVDVVQVSPGPTTTTFAGSANLNGSNNAAYANSYLCFLTGANSGETHKVQSYVAASRVFTLTAGFPVAPSAGDIFAIIARNE